MVREGRGSVSLLQRTLGIGYGRAARLIDYMAEDGIVGPYAGSQAREVVISLGDWEAMQAGGESTPEAAASGGSAVGSKRRKNKITPESDWDDAEEEDATAQSEAWDDGFDQAGDAEEDAEFEDGEDDWEEDECEEYEAESA